MDKYSVFVGLAQQKNKFLKIVAQLETLLRTCADLESSIQTSVQRNEPFLQQVLREALQGA